jgi:hypothetical protein
MKRDITHSSATDGEAEPWMGARPRRRRDLRCPEEEEATDFFMAVT